MPSDNLLHTLGLMVVAATALILLLGRLRIPEIVLCIAAGLLLGPLLGVVSLADGHGGHGGDDGVDGAIEAISHLGIVLLLFLVGLELSFDRIRDLGRVTAIAGVLQVLIVSALGFGLAAVLGFGWTESVVIGVAMTFSSTVVVIRLLAERGDLSSLHGRIAVGILLVQDLAVILGLTLLHGLGGGGSLADGLRSMPWALLGLGVLLATAILASRHLLDRPFSWAARNPQTLVVWGLAWCLLFVFLAEVLGLSSEIGAFLAGVALAQLPCAGDLERRLHPLMNFFVAVFFVALGAKMDLAAAASVWPSAIVLSIFVLLAKPAIVAWLVARCGYGEATCFRSGLILGQVSEFSFILVALAATAGLLSDEAIGLVGMVGLATIVVSAIAALHEKRLLARLQAVGGLRWLGATPEPPTFEAPEARGHVIVVGMTGMGRRVVEALVAEGERPLAIDTDPAKLRGLPCRTLHGTIDDRHVLETANLRGARLAITTLRIEDANRLFAHRCRAFGVPCIVHAAGRTEAADLERQGVDHVVDSRMQGNLRLVASLAERGVVTP
jgi:Kef-type K+ transport system membrane component KefB